MGVGLVNGQVRIGGEAGPGRVADNGVDLMAPLQGLADQLAAPSWLI